MATAHAQAPFSAPSPVRAPSEHSESLHMESSSTIGDGHNGGRRGFSTSPRQRRGNNRCGLGGSPCSRKTSHSFVLQLHAHADSFLTLTAALQTSRSLAFTPRDHNRGPLLCRHTIGRTRRSSRNLWRLTSGISHRRRRSSVHIR
jgi:hypothetical protein